MQSNFTIFRIFAFILAFILTCLQVEAQDLINLQLDPTLDCEANTICLSLQASAETDTFQIGASSIFINYDPNSITFSSYTSSSFDGSDDCIANVADAWTEQQSTNIPDDGSINISLSLSLSTPQFSCPIIDNNWVEIGVICFDIENGGVNPNVEVDSSPDKTSFNRHIPNNGTQAIPLGTLTGYSEIMCGTAEILGCTDATACNYDAAANMDDGSCNPVDCEGNCSGTATGPAITGSPCDDGDSTTENDTYTSNCTCTGTAIPTGCTDVTACNYDSNAVVDDGSCNVADCEGNCSGALTGPAVSGSSCDDGDTSTENDTYNDNCDCVGTMIATGCTDITACNYDSGAMIDDGSCNSSDCLGNCSGNSTGPAVAGSSCDDGDSTTENDTYDNNCNCVGSAIPTGCTDATACNYDSGAVIDDGSCDYGLTNCSDPCNAILGCTNEQALNFDINATCDDGTCINPTVNPTVDFVISEEENGLISVSMIPDVTWLGLDGFTATAQITLVVPNGFEIGNLTSVNGTWSSATIPSPEENPDFDYIVVGLTSLGTSEIDYVMGQEEVLFTFENIGECVESISLILEDDLFAVPNSLNANVGNQITSFGSGDINAWSGLPNMVTYECGDEIILGCTNANACNYNELANSDNGSCVEAGMIATNNETLTCSGDGEADEITAIVSDNNSSNYTYIITDASGTTILGGPLDSGTFDLEGAPAGTCLIWGIAYEDLEVPSDQVADITGCYEFSNSIAVVRMEADECGICDNDPSNNGESCQDCEGTPNGSVTAGSPCDDGDDTTLNDAYDGNCDCVGNAIAGCMDACSPNFNALATIEDDSCESYDSTCPTIDCTNYIWDAAECSCVVLNVEDPDCAPIECMDLAIVDCECVYTEIEGCGEIEGCTDQTACNYNPEATTDDGNCQILEPGMITTISETVICSGDGAADEVTAITSGNNGSNYTYIITDVTGTIILGGPLDSGTFDLEGAPAGTCLIWGIAYEDLEVPSDQVADITGCYEFSNSIAVVRMEADECGICDNDPSNNGESCQDCEGTPNGLVVAGSPCDDGDDTTLNDAYDGNCDCVGNAIAGCMDACSPNFNALATIEDDSCESYDSTCPTIDCTNYIWDAEECSCVVLNVEDPDCAPIECMDLAIVDCECVYTEIEGCGEILGCTNETACNYNPAATTDDGNCQILASGIITTINETTTCSGDGTADEVTATVINNNGSNYTYIITDGTGETILGGPNDSGTFDLEGAPAGTCLIWGIAYEDLEVPSDQTSDITGCYEFSNSIIVIRLEADECGICDDNPDNDGESCQDCEGTPNGLVVAGSPCDDGDDTTLNDAYDGNCDCVGNAIAGCMDACSPNFNALATIEDDSCESYDSTCPTIDCTNYIWDAAECSCVVLNVEDPDCAPIECMDLAIVDCECVYTEIEGCGEILGCTDQTACNYNPTATTDDDTCLILASGIITTSNETTTCSGDGTADEVTATVINNNGSNYTYIITDGTGETILGGPNDSGTFDLEGAPAGTCLIWGIAYEDLEVPSDQTSDITGCYEFSNSIAVIRLEADECGVCDDNPDNDGESCQDCEGTPNGSVVAGMPCDDGDSTTYNDSYDGNCNCVGQVVSDDFNFTLFTNNGFVNAGGLIEIELNFSSLLEENLPYVEILTNAPAHLNFVNAEGDGDFNTNTGLWNFDLNDLNGNASIVLSFIADQGLGSFMADVIEIDTQPQGEGIILWESVCISVPMQLCDEPFTLEAPEGMGSYQWYKDEILIEGATSQTYIANEVGVYTYDLFDPVLGDCSTINCCPGFVNDCPETCQPNYQPITTTSP